MHDISKTFSSIKGHKKKMNVFESNNLIKRKRDRERKRERERERERERGREIDKYIYSQTKVS